MNRSTPIFDIHFTFIPSTAEVGRSSYRAIYDVFYHSEKMGAFVKVLHAAGNEEVAHLEAIYELSGEKSCTKFLVRGRVFKSSFYCAYVPFPIFENKINLKRII